jgi:hypothetical protein
MFNPKSVCVGSLEFSEAMKVDVLKWHLYGPAIRVVASMLQNVDAHYQAHGFAMKD